MNFNIQQITPDSGPIIGISVFSFPDIDKIKDLNNAVITGDNDSKLEIPFQFLSGNSDVVRSKLHNMIDDFMDQFADKKKNKVKPWNPA